MLGLYQKSCRETNTPTDSASNDTNVEATVCVGRYEAIPLSGQAPPGSRTLEYVAMGSSGG